MGSCKHIGASKHGWCPYIWGTSKHTGGIQTWGFQTDGGVQTWGHSNIQGAIQTYQGIQTYRGAIQTYGEHPNKWSHPNIWGCIETYGASNHHSKLKSVASSATYLGASKHKGHPNIWGYPNIQGVHQDIWMVSKHMGHPNIQVGVHTGGCPNIRQHPNLQGDDQTYGSMQTYKHTGGIQTWGQSNIWGIWKPP